MFKNLKFSRPARGLRAVLLALGTCLGCNAIFSIEDPIRAPIEPLSCTLNSDCPPGAGQVCIFSRCSPPCAADVDCTVPGERCLQTDLGSACVSQAQAACDDADVSARCPSGAICVDGACYGACSGTEACSDGHTCEDGACKGPAPSGPMGGSGGQGGGGSEGGGLSGGTGGDSGNGGEAGGPVEPMALCGDGELGGTEECDGGDTEAGDGCSATCQVEEGWTCRSSLPSLCEAICGDGLVVGAEAEAGGCDDGDVDAADGCNATCEVEATFACSGQPSSCAKTCGNGAVDAGEGCDDGNTNDGDGCVSCAVASGFTCDKTKVPTTCADVNECMTGQGNCHSLATCTNTVGSFTCQCRPGYTGNGTSTCADVNECTEPTHDCHANANCTNSAGSFSCACKPGFTGTGKACTDVNECTPGNNDCHAYATCTNTPGSFTCACKGGLTGNGKTSCSFAQLVGKLDGRLVTIPCADTPNTDDCTSAGAISEGVTTACALGNLDAVYDHPVSGPAGVQYTATLHYYGILGPKNYGPNIVREAAPARPGNQDSGSSPPPYATSAPGAAYTANNYETAEVRVFDHNSVEVGSYFLNADTTDGHYTYVLNYERAIRIVGGGFVRIRIVDDNCRQIKNCGASGGVGANDCATKARSVNITAASPQPTGLSQPGLGQLPAHSGQWLLVDVTKVEPL